MQTVVGRHFCEEDDEVDWTALMFHLKKKRRTGGGSGRDVGGAIVFWLL